MKKLFIITTAFIALAMFFTETSFAQYTQSNTDSISKVRKEQIEVAKKEREEKWRVRNEQDSIRKFKIDSARTARDADQQKKREGKKT